MEVIGAIVGAGLLAVSPLVPGLRPVAKAFVKGGLAVAGASVAVAAAATHQVSDLVAKVRPAEADETLAGEEAVMDPITERDSAESAAAVVSLPGVRPVAKAVDAAKGAAGAAATSASGAAKGAAGAAKGAADVAKGVVGAAKGAAGAATAAVGGAAKGATGTATIAAGAATAAVSGVAKGAAGVAKGAAGAAVGAAAAAGQQIGGLAGVSPEGTTGMTGAGPATVDATSTSSTVVATEELPPSAEMLAPEMLPASDITAAQDRPTAGDDLRRIKGIGPKTAEYLEEAGITTFAQVAAMNSEQLRDVLMRGGTRFRVIDPSPWPERAAALMNADTPE